MCLCCCVLGFAAHSNILGDDSDVITPPTWILMTTLGMARTLRSVLTSSSIRSETPYDVYSVYESYCEDSFHTMFCDNLEN